MEVNEVNELNNIYFFTNKEVAKLLRTTEDTLRKRIEKGKYEGLYRKEGKYTLWNKGKLFAYLEIAA